MMQAIIKTVKITYIPVYTCDRCGQQKKGSDTCTFRNLVSVEDTNNQARGIPNVCMPIGWACFLIGGQDVYSCGCSKGE